MSGEHSAAAAASVDGDPAYFYSRQSVVGLIAGDFPP